MPLGPLSGLVGPLSGLVGLLSGLVGLLSLRSEQEFDRVFAVQLGCASARCPYDTAFPELEG